MTHGCDEGGGNRSADLLRQLRDGSRDSHRQVEAHPLLRPLLAPDITAVQYARVIAAFAGFHTALEAGLAPALSLLDDSDYSYRFRAPLLAADLAALPPCSVMPCRDVPEPRSVDELTGILYVVEGATQGGRVIAPLLTDRLGIGGAPGAGYFHAYRQGDWQRFRQLVARRQPRYDHTRVVAAAVATFHCLRTHLDRCLSDHRDQ